MVPILGADMNCIEKLLSVFDPDLAYRNRIKRFSDFALSRYIARKECRKISCLTIVISLKDSPIVLRLVKDALESNERELGMLTSELRSRKSAVTA